MSEKYESASDALKVFKHQSWLSTREELEKALSRLQKGKPKNVRINRPYGDAIPPITTICKEANVNQSGVYRHHKQWIEELKQRKANSQRGGAKNPTKAPEAVYKAKLAREREMVSQLEADKEKLARRNYQLVRTNEQLAEENDRLRKKNASLMRDINR